MGTTTVATTKMRTIVSSLYWSESAQNNVYGINIPGARLTKT